MNHRLRTWLLVLGPFTTALILLLVFLAGYGAGWERGYARGTDEERGIQQRSQRLMIEEMRRMIGRRTQW